MVSHLMKFVENCKSCWQVKSVYNLGSWRGDGAMTEIKGDKGGDKRRCILHCFAETPPMGPGTALTAS